MPDVDVDVAVADAGRGDAVGDAIEGVDGGGQCGGVECL